MKFGKLIDYNMKNIFLKKSYKKSGGAWVEKLFPCPFLKN